MSGRLSPQINKQIQTFPSDFWKDEFQKANTCGFDSIEWIFDLNNNPILHDDGLEEMRSLSKKYDVMISAVCADYFMQKMLFNVGKSDLKQNLDLLQKLIQRCSKLDIEILEIPFVDSSSLKTKSNTEQMVLNLQQIVDFANSYNVKITLETDLPPNDFKKLLKNFGKKIGANYDVGNSTALGYDLKEELQSIKPWLTNVHVKDRLYEGNTVPLGTGDTDFDSFFSTLTKINYNGQLIIQGAREDQKMIEPQNTCKKYLEFVKKHVDKYNLVTLKD
ncbi:MAG: xylulose 5-phosphate 3-epimerase [Thaumarchaeota archaeon]|nr:MAG: xylulose 5-phosphate 3-epimerase [Nitrososphaerota archaeon]